MEERILELINEDKSWKVITKKTGLPKKELFGRTFNLLYDQVEANLKTELDNFETIILLTKKLHNLVNINSVPKKYGIRKIAKFESKIKKLEIENALIDLVKSEIDTLTANLNNDKLPINFDPKYKDVHKTIFEDKIYEKTVETLRDYKMDIKYINNEHLMIYLVDKYIKTLTKKYSKSETNYYRKVINFVLQTKRFSLNRSDKKVLEDNIRKAKESFKRNKKLKNRKTLVNKMGQLANTIKKGPSKKLVVSTTDHKVLNRMNLVHEYTISIDDKRAKILDDALTFKQLKNGNYLLGVHITDPNGIETRPLILNEELLRRIQKEGSESGLRAPIFANPVRVKELSLANNEVRKANSLLAEIDRKGNIVNYSFEKTLISVSRSLSFVKANTIMCNRNDKDNNLLNDLYSVCDCLKQKNAGKQIYNEMILFQRKKSLCNHHDFNLGQYNNRSHTIVEESMVLYNHLLAKHCEENKIPFIYKNCEETDFILNDKDDFKHVFDRLKLEGHSDKKIIKAFLKLYPISYFSTENRGHSPINLPAYCSATSPLRKDSSKLSAFAMEKCMFGEPSKDEKQYISDSFELLASHISKYERNRYASGKIEEKAKKYIKELKRF